MLNHFLFQDFNQNEMLITNDFGKYAFVNKADFTRLVSGKQIASQDLTNELKGKLFLLDETDLLLNTVVNKLRKMKSYVFDATTLHIFVVSNCCNLQCVYCQAQANAQASNKMSAETARKAVDVALQCPSNHLTFEFQGGEPLTNYEVIHEIVSYTERANRNKRIDFTLVSNLSLLTDEMLSFFKRHNVAISTSLDGPKALHDHNRRHIQGLSSHDLLCRGINMARSQGISVGGIETTTRRSFDYPKEIVREYNRLGFNGLFIRPLTPLGHAAKQWDAIGYTTEEFIEFYKKAFDKIIRINLNGTLFPEQSAALLLRRILKGDGLNYMELRSPCGAGIGQLAYYYDGNVYTCDEARMVAETGDTAFRLGNVATHNYADLVSCDTCRAVCTASITESLPGCCDCVYQPYCSVCPIVNYAIEGDIQTRVIKNYRCKINYGILQHLFELLHENDADIMRVLNSWLGA